MKNRSQEIYNDHDYLFLSRRTYAYVNMKSVLNGTMI